MKKSIRALFLAAFMFLTLFTMPAFAYDISATQDTLTIENGVFTNENARPIQEAIDQYFEQRESGTHSMSAPLVSQELISDSDDRTASMHQYYRDMDLYVIDYENSTEILNAEPIQGTRNIAVTVYEWTWLNYCDKENPSDNYPIEEMGFSTTHEMALSPVGSSYQVVSDSYDENDITGHVSKDYIAPPVIESPVTEVILEREPDASIMALTYLPSLSKCVTYANQYVKYGCYAPNSETSYTDYYNLSKYSYEKANDCSNYVSQCLHAGGFSFDPSSTSGRVASSKVQWWHSENGNFYSSSMAWRCADDFVDYWTLTRGYTCKSLTYSNSVATNAYPGNPIISDNRNHVAICVGYNEYKKPVYNGHTRDVYHGVVNSSYTETLFLNCAGNHTAGYVYNMTHHFKGCTRCHYPYTSSEVHSYRQSGVYYICTVCGYKTTNPAGISAISPHPAYYMYNCRSTI